MRGDVKKQATMLSLVGPEQRVPGDHPLRRIKKLADAQLEKLSPVLTAMYAPMGRPSIPPETLLKACLLIALYSVRSERQFCERLDYDLLFRFFLDMGLEEASFDASTFAKNKERLLKAEVARLFFEAVVERARQERLMSQEHFTVDGTLIEAWASLKSFKKKDGTDAKKPPPDDPGNPTVNFHGEKRSNSTHESKTDPEARLARKGKGKEAKLSFAGHVLMENRHGLIADVSLSQADGYAEREQALRMIRRQKAAGVPVSTVGGDKGYDTADFVQALRAQGVTPHVAQNITAQRDSNIDGRTVRHPGYAVSQRIRKRVEEIFGWAKTVAGLRKARYRGQRRVGLQMHFAAAAYNLVRMAKLMPMAA
jgi:transposase